MKQFKILHYLKKWRYFIAICMIVGGTGFYYYAKQQQTYTASVVISYTNASASQGQLPGGSTLDVSDILSSRVINGVVSDLNTASSVEGIRSACDITEIIPEDEEVKKDALLADGKDYVYYPTKYVIKYTAGSSSSREWARRVVSAILDNYFRVYTEKYIADSVLPDNTANLIGENYDYVEKADILEQSVASIMTFLQEKADANPDYRSSKTGFCFKDLYNIYEYIYDNMLPYLYSQIIDDAITQNAGVIAIKYRESINKYQLSLQNFQNQIDYLDRVINTYTAKLDEGLNATSELGGADQGKAVLQSVYEWSKEGTVDRKTTYNKLIDQRISYQLKLRDLEISRQHDADMLGVFDAAVDSANAGLSTSIDALISELSAMHGLVSATYDEFNQYMTSKNLSVLSNINASAGLNIKLYLALTVVVFFVFGCVGSVILGRGEDIVEYIVYNDQKVGLPNRARCDIEVAKYDGAILPDNFCCIVITLNNLRVLNDINGYASGNTVLRQLGLIIKEITNNLGFVGYNNSGQYLCLFDDCTQERAKSVCERLLERADQYNEEVSNVHMNISAAYACTTESKVYEIKQLIRLTYQAQKEQG